MFINTFACKSRPLVASTFALFVAVSPLVDFELRLAHEFLAVQHDEEGEREEDDEPEERR